MVDSMRAPNPTRLRVFTTVTLAGLLLFAGGCANSLFIPQQDYRYFTQPSPEDAWSRKIRGWQARERRAAPPHVAEAGDLELSESRNRDLRNEYDAFRAEQRRQVARDLARWIQSQAVDHYEPDGHIDHWATLEETLARGEDPCDPTEP